MKITELKEGQVIKNYKELCKILGEKVVPSNNTNGRKSHHKKFERYFEYTKEGHKYIITKIYDKKLQKEENRGGNNKVYVDDFEKLMIYHLYKDKSEMKLLSKTSIYKIMDLHNGNYNLGRDKISKLCEILEVPTKSLYEFYDMNSGKLTKLVERNLKALRSKSLITYESVMCVAKEEAEVQYNELLEPILIRGKMQYETVINYREATKEERQALIRFENEVLKEYEVFTHKDIYLKGKWNEYTKKVRQKIYDSNLNIKYYYRAYRITYNNDHIEEYYNMLNFDNEQAHKDNINTNYMKSVEKGAKTRHTNASKKVDKSNIDIFRSSETYVYEQVKISEYLINNKADSLKEELDKKVDYKKVSDINNGKKIDNEYIEQLNLDLSDLTTLHEGMEENIPF